MQRVTINISTLPSFFVAAVLYESCPTGDLKIEVNRKASKSQNEISCLLAKSILLVELTECIKYTRK